MPKAAKKSSTNIVTTVTTPDPVVILSSQLFDLWHADDAPELSLKPVGEDIQRQITEWRRAVTNIISFTQATSLAGALVQLAIALDELDALEPVEEPETRKQNELREFRITRLVASAMRAVRESLGAEFESVREVVELYHDIKETPSGSWLDDIPRLAAEGRAARESEEGAL